MLRVFGFSIFFTVASIVAALLASGPGAAATIVVLIAIEVAFSVDNAVLNAKILERLSRVWQQLFLTVGMVIAILGMRFVFPIVIVMITAGLPWHTVLDEALNNPESYGRHLEHAHAAIAAFGGAFLLTLTLYFLFDDARQELWLKGIERRLQKLARGVWLPTVIALVVVGLVALVMDHDSKTVLEAGLLGVLSYTGLKLLIDALGKLAPEEQKVYSGWPAFTAFLYLQLLDAAFSFDGVLGAFAITNEVLLIVLGLSVGAFWVRSLTVYLVRHGTLNNYKYLEHGAHYAILVLALALLSSLFFEIPDAITGVTGIGIIVASVLSSREALAARRSAKNV